MYRAKDTKLKRDVAIKILPDEFSRDTDRVSRFQREAEALAALNHQNIAAIYDLQQSDQARFLILEFVEGDTLADILNKRGALPVDESLPIAKQICEALEAAHEKGIIHRDLKPANVKITPEGKVKVLDFGLAKAFEAESSKANLSQSPTLSMAATNAGVILGTAAYMSPEQARGKPVDKRADIWAFGVVLYEMLTGRAAFDGEDVADILSRVLQREPDWALLPANAPPRIHKLLKRCLQKDPKKRLRDIGDMELLLEDAPDAIAARRTKLPWAIAGVLAVALAFSSWAALWRLMRAEPAERPLVRLDVDFGPDVSLGSSGGADVILSPRGNRLAYVSQSRLFTRRLDQPRAAELPGTEGAYAPFFSPDGQWIAFFAGGKLKTISVEGGTTLSLCDASIGRGGSWGEDGSIIASLGGTFLSRISAAGGQPTPVTELMQGDVTHRWPQILPGGKAVLFTSNSSTTGWDGAKIEVMSLEDRRRKTLQRGGYFGRYLGTASGQGYLIYMNGGTLFAVPFDPDRLEVRGMPSPLINEIAYSNNFGFAAFDASQTGTLAYYGGAGGGLLTVQWLDGTDKMQPLLASPGVYQRPRLSPDGQRLALTATEGPNQDIWIYELQRENLSRLTFGGGHDGPVWSPDGRYIVFMGQGGMFWTRSDGAGKPQMLTQSKNTQYPFSFAPDGKSLAFLESSSGIVGYDLWTLPLMSDDTALRPGKPEVFLQTPFDERHPSFSPDGHWLAYSSNESGVFQVYVRAFPDKGGKWQISNNGGVYPVFSRNGRELFFRTEENRVMVASYTVKADSFAADKPRLWSQKQIADLGIVLNYDLAPDGKRVAVLMPAERPETQKGQNHVTFLLNFFDEVRRRVAAGNK